MTRFSIANLLAIIGVLAAELAAVKVASDPAMRTTCTTTFIILMIALIGAAVGRGPEWRGFTIAGWGFALMMVIPPFREVAIETLVGIESLEDLRDSLHPLPPKPIVPTMSPGFLQKIRIFQGHNGSFDPNADYFGLDPEQLKQIADPKPSNRPTFPKPPKRSSFTPSDGALLDHYVDQVKRYESQSGAVEQARPRAMAIMAAALCLAAGLAGAGVARFLAQTDPNRVTPDRHPEVGLAHQPTVGGTHPNM